MGQRRRELERRAFFSGVDGSHLSFIFRLGHSAIRWKRRAVIGRIPRVLQVGARKDAPSTTPFDALRGKSMECLLEIFHRGDFCLHLGTYINGPA